VKLAPDPFSSRRDTLAFIICLLLSLTARLAPSPVQDAVATTFNRTVLAPFLLLQEQAEVIKVSKSRYAQVVGLRDSMVVRALEAVGLEEENEELRALLGLSDRLAIRHVSAEALREASPASGFITLLSAGSDAGIQPKAPIVTAGGLVGVVQSVSAHRSVALLWTHPDFRVSAMTLDGSAFGIVAPRGGEGPNTMLLELRGVPYQQELAPGTMIYTSGLGGAIGVYPRGIPIGSILAIGAEDVGWSRTYIVRPAVPPGAVSHVIVLIGAALDLSSAFDPDGRP
jgi:rod shape-determining protein MreC